MVTEVMQETNTLSEIKAPIWNHKGDVSGFLKDIALKANSGLMH